MLLKIKHFFWIIFLLFDLCVLAAVLGGVYYLESDGPRVALEEFLGDKLGRKVVFEENLDLIFYPWVGLDTGPVRVSGPPGADYEHQLTLKDIDFKVRLIPLLHGDLEVDTIIVDSPVLRLDRGLDGELDLPEVRGSAQGDKDKDVELLFNSLSVRGVSVVNATCIYNDLETGNSFNMSGVNIRTGLLRKGLPLAYDVKAMLDTDLLDIKADAEIKGLLDFSWKDRQLSLSETTLLLSASSDQLLEDGEDLKAVASLDFNLVDGLVDVKGLVVQTAGVRLSGAARCENIYHSPEFMGSLKSTSFNPRDVISKIHPVRIPTGVKNLLHSASFSVDFHSSLNSTALSNMTLVVDDTAVKGGFSLTDYGNPWVEFDVHADSINLDPYAKIFRSNSTLSPLVNAGTNSTTIANKEGRTRLKDMVIADLVRMIPCKGRVELGRLIYDGMDLDRVRLDISPGPKVAGLSIGKGSYLDGDFSLNADLDFSSRNDKDRLYLKAVGEITPFSLSRIPLRTDDIIFKSGRAAMKLNSLSSQGKTIVELVRNLKLDLDVRADEVAVDLADDRIPAEYRNPRADKVRFSVQAAPLGGVAPEGLIGRRVEVGLDSSFQHPDVKIKTGFKGQLYCNRRHPDRVKVKDGSVVLAVDGSGLPVLTRGFELSFNGGGSLKERSLQIKDFSLTSGNIDLSSDFVANRLTSETAFAKGILKLAPVEFNEILTLFGIEPPETQGPDGFGVAELDTSFQLNGENLNLRVNRARLGNATADATFELVDFEHPFLNFIINGHDVDVDRFLPPDEDEVDKSEANGTESFEVKLPEWQFPDALLGAINASGKVQCNYFRIFDFGGSRVGADVNMENSVIDIRNLKADFHKGTLAGRLGLGLRNGTVTLDTNLQGRGFDAGLFFADYVGHDYVRGKTDASLKLKGSSSANTYFSNSMTGSLIFKITDGSYLFGATETQEKKEKKEVTPTGFSIMQGTISGVNGTFDVQDYLLKTDYLTATAAGGFSFPEDSINLQVNADIIKLPNLYLKLVNALLEAFTGVNVTVTGKMSDPKVEVKGLQRWSDVLKDVLGLPEQSFMFFRDLIF